VKAWPICALSPSLPIPHPARPASPRPVRRQNS
jgi:hypothetical protein